MKPCRYCSTGYHPTRHGIGWKATFPHFGNRMGGFDVWALSTKALADKAMQVYEANGYYSVSLFDHHAQEWRAFGPEWHPPERDCGHFDKVLIGAMADSRQRDRPE
jgi:hypothetical protein